MAAYSAIERLTGTPVRTVIASRCQALFFCFRQEPNRRNTTGTWDVKLGVCFEGLGRVTRRSADQNKAQ